MTATGPRTTRRQAMLLLGSALLPPVAAAASGLRVAAIDWALLETALALGIAPVAATELIQFRAIAIEPTVPATVVDLGLRGTPNYELLRMVAPDVILISNFYEYQRGSLESIAPVLSLPIYEAGEAPYARAEHATSVLGDRLAASAAASASIMASRATLAGSKAALAGVERRPVFIISLGDARHFRAFGADSMFGDVLSRLGFDNAWTEPTSYSATAPVSLDALARRPDAFIAVVGPVPPEVAAQLDQNALWQSLPAVQNGLVAFLPPVNHFGALPAADRFARLFSDAFANARPSHG